MEGVLATCVDDGKESVAIYSYPDLIGSVYAYSKTTLNNLKGKTSYYEDEVEYIDTYGNSTYWSINKIIILGKGETRYLRCTFIDETEKVKAIKEVKKQKMKMEIILNNIPDVVIKVNDKGEYTYRNKANIEKLYPYNPNEESLTNKEVFKFLKYSDIDGNELDFNDTPDVRVLRGEKLTNYVVVGTSHLHTTYYECNGTPIYDEQGNVESAVIIYRDIKDGLRLDEYNALAKNIKGMAIKYAILSYEDFKIKYVNDNVFKVVKRSHPNISSVIQLVGKSFFDFYNADIDEKKKIMDRIKECVGLKNESYIYTQKVVEEETRYIKTIFQPMYNKNNVVEKINVIGIDITKEETINQKMSRALKSQEEIFVNTSHELKTSINLIFSASQLLELYFKNEDMEIQRYKIENNNRIITQNCYRIIKLINNILDVSKIEHGFYVLNLENKNIVTVIDDMVESVSEYIKDKDLKIIFDPQVEQKIMALDLYKFERIMLNLISNAIKFSKVNGVILISLIDKGEYVEICVKDNGIGIDEKSIDGIFDKFKQENKSLNRRVEGTGIGLSLVKSLVEVHGGKISVTSIVNKGSTFSIELPIIMVDETKKTSEEYQHEDRVEMIRFELSDIYS